MLTFTLSPRRWWLVCAFGRNPMVRGTDRFEALVIMLVIVVSLLAAPVAGAVGTALYDARRQQYAGEVRTAHTADPIANSRAEPVGVSDVWPTSRTTRVNPPTSTTRAGADGVCAGAAILLSVVAAAATLVAITHLRLSRMRNANWERELRCLANDDGGRNDRSHG